MISIIEMIINEKYLQDIDDDDEDEIVDMPNRKIVSDKTTFEHHVIVELNNTYLLIAPTKFQLEKNLK